MLTGAGLSDSFVDRWTRRSPDEMAASLRRIESEAVLANLYDPRWSPGLCARLAGRALDPVACADACLRHDLPADLVGPFVARPRAERHVPRPSGGPGAARCTVKSFLHMGSCH